MTTNNALIVKYEDTCKIPCVKIETIDHDDTGYLMPFQACMFQVCATPDGEGDLGASDARDMRGVLKWMPEADAINWLREQSIIAIMRWRPDMYGYGVSLSDDGIDIFEDWLTLCYEWLKGKNTWKPTAKS